MTRRADAASTASANANARPLRAGCARRLTHGRHPVSRQSICAASHNCIRRVPRLCLRHEYTVMSFPSMALSAKLGPMPASKSGQARPRQGTDTSRYNLAVSVAGDAQRAPEPVGQMGAIARRQVARPSSAECGSRQTAPRAAAEGRGLDLLHVADGSSGGPAARRRHRGKVGGQPGMAPLRPVSP